MAILENLKEHAECATGLRRAGTRKAIDLARMRKPYTVHFKNGLVRNHQRWPPAIYRRAVALDDGQDPAAVIDLFKANGRGDTWRDLYDYMHYHFRIEEALGIAWGKGATK